MSGILPWDILYPHRVTVRRNLEQPVAGKSPYDGLQANAETVIYAGLACNIQIDRTGRPPEAKLPGDPVGQPTMKIMFPSYQLDGPGYGDIKMRDVLVDGLGNRYQVIVNEWQIIGSQIRAQVLEA